MKNTLLVWRFTSFLLVLSILFALLFGIAEKTRAKTELDAFEAESESTLKTVVLDAGHGGEDGGAVAFDGTVEKDLNLSFTRKIALFFEILGIISEEEGEKYSRLFIGYEKNR